MNVGMVVPGFSADAADWCIPALRNLVERLALTDDIRVLALRYPSPGRRYGVAGAAVAALGGGTAGRTRSAGLWARVLAELAAQHRHRRFDVLHAFWANETGALTALAGRLLDVPTVVSLAGGELVAFRDIDYGGQLAQTERAKVLVALRLARTVTTGSVPMLRLVEPWVGPDDRRRIERIPLGVDTSMFVPGPRRERRGPPVLVHAASLSLVKDQATLVRALAHVRRCGRECLLEIAGTGDEEARLRRETKRREIEHATRFLGAVPHDAMPAIYRGGDIFVLSSRHEAQCMAALEAAACGLPVVGTAVGVVPELAPAAGAVAPVGDDRALAACLGALLTDPHRRQEMALAARARVEAEYSLALCVERFRSLYAATVETFGRSGKEGVRAVMAAEATGPRRPPHPGVRERGPRRGLRPPWRGGSPLAAM